VAGAVRTSVTSFLPVFALFALASLKCHRTGGHTRLPSSRSHLHTHTSLSSRHATRSAGFHLVVGAQFGTSGSLFDRILMIFDAL
jgi:hypothetical protein